MEFGNVFKKATSLYGDTQRLGRLRVSGFFTSVILFYYFIFVGKSGGFKRDIQKWGLPFKRRPCTETETLGNIEYINKNGGFNQFTACPVESWLIEWREKLSPQEIFTTVEAGCNKATDAVFMLKLFSREESLNLYDWIQRINMSNTFSCPPVDEEKYEALVQMLPKCSHIMRYQHHCIEPVKETFAVVSKVTQEMGYHNYGLNIYQYVVTASNDPAFVQVSPVEAGTETVGIDTIVLANLTYRVPTVSIDKFILDNNIEGLQILKIDTEGNDPRVLLGAARTLAIMKPSYLFFENHGIGQWSTFDLKDIIDYLDNLSYDCYWATRIGSLVRITSCWSAEYGKWKDWSNIACVHRGDRLLRSIFEKYSYSPI